MNKYPTQWQRKMMWASLTAVFVVVLFGIVGTVVWIGANVVAFLQPILIPVAIGVILAYLLDPLVTYLARRGFGRTKGTLCIFAIAFIALAGLLAWIVPLISVQSASLASQLPNFTVHVRDRVVDLMYRYESTFGLGEKNANGDANVGIVNWLLAAPSTAALSPTPAAAPTATPAPGSGEVIAPSPSAENDQASRSLGWSSNLAQSMVRPSKRGGVPVLRRP